MKINGRHISSFYSEMKEIESFVYSYDLEVLEGLLKFVRGNREELKRFCIELAVSNPPRSEDNSGYPYPDDVEPIEYWLQNQALQFDEFDYYEALISRVFEAKIPEYMKIDNCPRESRTKGKPHPESEFDFKGLFPSNDLYAKFINGLISLEIIDEITKKVKPDANYSEIGGILRLLHTKGFIVRKLTNSELQMAAKLFGYTGKEDTLRKGKFDDKLFNKHFLNRSN